MKRVRRNLVITAANKKTESFLLYHWLRSLLETTDTKDTDIVVLDYGMSTKAIHALKKSGVIIVSSKANGHIVNIRLRDAATYIQSHEALYNQVLFIDSGDVIFQSDITPVFQTHTQEVRITSQNMPVDFIYHFSRKGFSPSTYRHILAVVAHKPVLNAGVIIAPTKKMVALLRDAYALIQNARSFFPDQVAINYLLHKDGYSPLPEHYNFMKLFSSQNVRTDHGVIKTPDGVPIPIVHNCGGKSYLRAYKNFGYGSTHNIPNQPVYLYTEVKAIAQRMMKKFFLI